MQGDIFIKDSLQMLFEDSDDFVFLMKREKNDYRYIYANKSALATVQNLKIGSFLSETVEPHSCELITKNYDIALKTKVQQSFQDYVTSKSDVEKFETTVIPIVNDAGEFVFAQTKQIVFERDLEDKYLFIRSVFSETFLSTILVSPNFELLEANPRFLREFGLNIEEIRGQSIFNLGVFSEKSLKCYQQVALNANEFEFETLEVGFIDQKGETRNFIATTSPIVSENKIISHFIILQETTKMVQQARKIKEYSHSLDVFKKAIGSAAEISITDRNGRIVDVNERFLNRTGYSREEVIGHTHNVVNSRFHTNDFFEDIWETISSGRIWSGEICNKNKFGVTYWNDLTIIPLVNLDGEIDQYLGIYFDISEKKKIMMMLRNTDRIFRIITENTNDLIVIVDDIDVITYASPSYSRLLGIPVDRIVGRLYSELLDPKSRNVWKDIRCGSARNQSDYVELKLQKANGEKVWTEGHFKRVSDERFDDLSQITMVSREITERRAREKNLMFLAFHDSLTHLPNRRYLEKEFPNLVEDAIMQDESIAVCYIDGDNFKQVNDLYGHDVGDEFIRNVGLTLKSCIRQNDLVVRMGGDEFVVVLNHLSIDKEEYKSQVQAFYRRLQEEFEKGWIINGVEFKPTCSMGVTNFPHDAMELDTLIDFADRALVDMKRVKRNDYQLYHKGLLLKD